MTRALISLFDRQRQHIVAEATQTSPLAANVNEDDDGLWLCGTSIPRSFGICEHVLVSGSPEGSPPMLPVSVVPDLADDDRFCTRPFVHGKPGNRFYAGVPIRTPEGINIGVYCIFDERPRDGLTGKQAKFMQDMSHTVMDYLAQRRSNDKYRRSERMVRGMGNFVEGQESLSVPTSPGPSYNLDDSAVTEQPLSKMPPITSRDSQNEVSRTQDSYWKVARGDTPSPGAKPQIASTYSSASPPTPRPNSKTHVSQVSTTDIQLAEAGRVFAKAANIIRESIEVEGVLFLDATVRSFGGLVGDQHENTSRSLEGLSGDEDSGTPTQSAANREDLCNVLGFSTRDGSSIKGDRIPWQFEGLRDKTLQRLLTRYSNGKIFNFDADGTALPGRSKKKGGSGESSPPPTGHSRQWSQDSMEQYRPGMRGKRWNEAAAVYQMFPGARSVAIVPLWDGRKKRWAAGGFIWTTSPTRIFAVDGELGFLKVFGLTIMAEINRMDTKAEESIKSNILGSLSHELRSPLHGLVGAVELLHDSKLDAVQQNVLHIIETSGKTLVDTINHLLDYSKINSFLETDKADQRDSVLGKVDSSGGKYPGKSDPRSRTLPVELDCIVEEVVESVLAGFSHEMVSTFAHTYANFSNYEDSANPALALRQQDDKRVQIYLDVEPCTSWRFQTHPGAVRRIVMNLFGNSLKFTQAGFIRISLTQEIPKPYQHSSGAKIILTVSDSGKGISEEYLRNHLFTPFCQEDNFAPGTGLGLSLVRQIAVNLGGDINVASQVGHGTVITVSIPLRYAEDAAESETDFVRDARRLVGEKVLLRGFETTQPSALADDSQGLGRLPGSPADFLESTLCKWLQMEVCADSGSKRNDFGRPSLIVHNDYSMTIADAERIATEAPCPVVFISDISMAVRSFSCNLSDVAKRKRVFEFLSPPFGPRKLAKVFVHLLNQWQEARTRPNTGYSGSEALKIMSEMVTSPVEMAKESVLKKTDNGPNGKVVEVDSVTLVKVSGQAVVLETSSLKVQATQATEPFSPPPLVRAPVMPAVMGSSAAAPMSSLPTCKANTEPVVLIVDDNAINLKVSPILIPKHQLEYYCSRSYLCSIDPIGVHEEAEPAVQDGHQRARVVEAVLRVTQRLLLHIDRHFDAGDGRSRVSTSDPVTRAGEPIEVDAHHCADGSRRPRHPARCRCERH